MLARVAVLLTLGLSAFAQQPVGHVRLEVRDPSGAAVRAQGKLHNLASGAVQDFQTDSEGVQAFDSLAYGRYRVEVAAPGFSSQTVAIDVRSASPVVRTITLSVSARAFQVDVVAATPLAGTDLSRSEIPLPIQAGNARDLEQSGAADISDFLNKRLNGVHVNEIQGNPYQTDINYRGYTASPLLGTPQGISIYMDGVRLNQPFGDVVSWDLVPRMAVAEVALIPGSNPLFGLNTLGGALSLETKDGKSFDHTSVVVSGGSFGRKAAELEHGGALANGLNWYVASNLFFDDGWRPTSSSNVRQFFGKLGWQHNATSLGLTVSYANNLLTGNGLQEVRMLNTLGYRSIYTKPDITSNRAPFFNFSARHSFGGRVSLSGNVYHRYIRTSTLNGDLNDDSLDQSIYQPSAADQAALRAAGYTGFPTSGATAANTPFPFWRCIAQALQRDEPGEKCNGLLNRTQLRQHNAGFSVQATWFASHGAWRNQFTAGTAFDRSSAGLQQLSELGYLNPDRSITGVRAFGDGVTGGSVDNEPFDTRVDLDGLIHTASLFATDTLSRGGWNVTLSGRYNRTTIGNRDRIRPTGAESLTANYTFDRFNPALGLTYTPTKAINLYFSYSEGSRAPTSIELGCANPDLPCKLPTALAGDPPLNQVVAKTLEAGVRSGSEGSLSWSAGWFRAQNTNDLLFVASPQTAFGYFKNFGETRRQGLETELNGKIGRFSLGGGYTFLDATYQTAETVAVTGPISPGDRLPLTPRHMLKTYAVVRATRKLTVDLGFTAISSSLARGDENHLHPPDGVYYLGPGYSPGYGLANLQASYQALRHVQFFVQINNLLNHRYFTAAQIGPTGFTAQGTYLARPLPAVNGAFPLVNSTFFAPGAPIAVWSGVRVSF